MAQLWLTYRQIRAYLPSLNLKDFIMFLSTDFQDQRQQARTRILLIDDDRLMRLQAIKALEKLGFDVTEAASGFEALEIIKQQDFDAVLLDLLMPGMDGYSVCRRIRAIKRDEFLPIIMLTGRDNHEAIEQAFLSGVTDFETKPVDWLRLNQRIGYLTGARLVAKNLEVTEHHRNALIETIPDTLLTLDAGGRVLGVKPAIYGFDINRLPITPGANLFAALPPAAADRLRKALIATIDGEGEQNCEIELKLGKQSFYLEVRMVLAGNGLAIAMIRDFSERHLAEQEFQKLAFYDPVTELPNRVMMQNYIRQQVGKSVNGTNRIALIMFTMVGFDYARGVLGTRYAEAVLREISTRVNKVIRADRDERRPEETMLGRIGDAGFAVIYDDFDHQSQIDRFTRKLKKKLEQRYILGDYEINLSSRIGIATFDDEDRDGSELIERASIALERSDTDSASGITFYSAQMRRTAVKRAQLLKDLRLALKNSELYLVYQPKIDALNGRLVGVEALLRWQNKKRGLVSPAEFIPLAEQNNLILRLGDYVLEEACRQSRAWLNDGLEALPIAVNFSGHQLNHRGLVDNLQRTLDKYSIDHQHIEIELTESVALEKTGQAESIVSDLNDLGFRLSIDDFGTGYSSLSSLNKMPFHTLKIDRSFIGEIGIESNAGPIVEGIVNMAHALDMNVVAEGVEEIHQLEFLRRIHCDTIQGYLTGRPVSAAQITELMLAS